MKYKFTTLAITVAMLSPLTAHAAMDVYGKVRMTYVISDNGAKDGDGDEIDSISSRLGFKGSHTVKEGLDFIWQIENTVEFDNDSGGDIWGGARNTFGGLKGRMGTVLAGKHDTPYKLSSKKVEIWGDSWGDYNAVVGANSVDRDGDTVSDALNHDARLSNVIAYISPEVNGLQFLGAYKADENHAKADESAISIAGIYNKGPLNLGLAHQVLKDTGVGGDDDTATKLTGAYTFGNTTAGVVYEMFDAGGNNNERENVYASVNHKVGKTSYKLGVGQIGELDSVNDSDATYVVFGLTRTVTEALEWYALYTTMRNGDAGTHGLDQLSAGKAGADLEALSVGFNYIFDYAIAK